MMKMKRIIAAAMAGLLCIGAGLTKSYTPISTEELSAAAATSGTTIADLPSNYKDAADWIWENRVLGEKSMEAWNTIYDQIVAGNGTLNYIVRWQSYKTITLQQRQQLQQVLESSINEWTNWLVGYDDWPFEHVNVKIVGWAVLDESCLLDRQSNETVYTDTIPYDNSYDISANMGDSSIPTVVPALPNELFRYEHWADTSYEYPGGYENRFDMHLHATQGLIDVGGYGYYWGQQLSDNAILGLCDGTTSVHVLQHEMGHGFGLTDFYGGEGESDGFPPGGFPDGGTSIMMAGSSQSITNFDGWFLRYAWTKIKAESGRFDLSAVSPTTTAPPATTTTTAETTVTTAKTTTATTAQPSGDEIVLPVSYNSEDNCWLVETNGSSHVVIQAQGLPYSALSGKYVYWDHNNSEWISDDWMMPESLGAEGISTFTVDIPEGKYASQIQIHVEYYALWDNDANDMVDRDPSGLVFTAAGSGNAAVTTASTAATTTTAATTETTDSGQVAGDVNNDGTCGIADVVMMQKWLLHQGGLTNWRAGDLYQDNVINGFDLSLMRRMLID